MITPPMEPITDDDAHLRAALQAAELPALLPALAYITGDLALLRPELRGDPLRMREPQGGLSDGQQEAIRALAVGALAAFRDGGGVAVASPDAEGLHRIMEHCVGGPVPVEYLPMLREELSVTGQDLRAPDWHMGSVAPDRRFLVAIIGAGMSGILAAHRLQQAGVPFVVLEKNGDVGGTWFENTYPGCRVDVTNHVYSYSCAQRNDWPLHFSTQDVLLDYFRKCADAFGVRPHIRFHTEVSSMVWDDDRGTWQLELRTSDGDVTEEATLEANAVVSAVGQLNRPKMPDIAGMGTFEGPSFHSAEWDHSVDLTGRRVAVVGTGASAVQFVPVIAPRAAEVEVFQRTPNWFFPNPQYHAEVASGLQWLYRHVPTYAQWHRFWLFWRGTEGVLPACRVDPAWTDLDRSVSPLNDELRALLSMYIEAEFADRRDLLAKVLPSYPPASKRIVVDNGSWATALKRPNVRLRTEGIEAITATGVRTAEGVDVPADVIVYATGFQASHFLTPMKVVGRGGVDLHEQWDGNARAYVGVTVPNFPNFYLLYGPNTNIVVNGSIVYFSECEVQYALGCIRMLLAGGHRAHDCRAEVHDAYNVRIDEGNRTMVWGVSKVNSWYKSASGRVAQNWPFSLLEYWQQTRAVRLDDYDVL
jgi:4-hydroxyacetophenone monooxygenase